MIRHAIISGMPASVYDLEIVAPLDLLARIGDGDTIPRHTLGCRFDPPDPRPRFVATFGREIDRDEGFRRMLRRSP